jgi:hypothetical protein
MERVKPFHPEALEKGIETPINLEPFVLPRIDQRHRPQPNAAVAFDGLPMNY